MYQIVLIDDEQVVLEGLNKLIDWKGMGCRVVGQAEDGETGLDLIRRFQPDIILTDIRMPKLDGLDMISAIRKVRKDSRIIILTGYRDFEYAQRGISMGVFRFLTKPTRKKDIIAAVQDAITEIEKSRKREKEFQDLRKQVSRFYGFRYDDIALDASGKPDSGSAYLAVRSVQYIRDHYMENLDLQQVADGLYISTWHLCRVLKRETGNTFVNILNQIRIDAAKELLDETNDRIYEIANHVGYPDVTYFGRVFKQITGCTPSEYRNRMIRTK